MSPKTLVASLTLPLMLLPGLPARGQEEAEPGGQVTWSLYRELSPGQRELRFSCGRYGSFEIANGALALRGKAGKSTCKEPKAEACGVEAPAIYPSPPLIKLPREAQKAAGDGWVPCPDRTCFREADTIKQDTLWIAVIDWDDPHGWSVGWLIDHLSRADNPTGNTDITVVLFPLYDDDLRPFSSRGATDVHVLKKLCEVAEIADGQNSPPLLVNMSFGRLWHGAQDPTSATSCNPDTLSCQIARVLRHLTCSGEVCDEAPERPRTIPVAAAGNHRKPQFPASLSGVVPAGSLQIALYRDTGKAEPGWETPRYEDKVQAWVPGYGLCFEEGGAGWPAPAGTSYAAAFFSGWLGALLGDSFAIEGPLSPEVWAPGFDGSSYHLVHGPRRYPSNPAVDAFLETLFQNRPTSCQKRLPQDGSPKLAPHEEAFPIGIPSFLEALETLVDQTKQPAPMDRPCVPCIGIETARPPQPRPSSKIMTEANLVIDRRGSAGSPLAVASPDLLACEITVEGLYLRLGEKYFALKAASGTGWEDLRFPGAVSLTVPQVKIEKGDQPSLIYVYSYGCGGISFWNSVPVLVTAGER